MANPDIFSLGECEPQPWATVRIASHRFKKRDRVRLRPTGGSNIFDLPLDGKLATVASVEEDLEGRVYVAVTMDEDPAIDPGQSSLRGHHFFFGVEEVEPLSMDAIEGSV